MVDRPRAKITRRNFAGMCIGGAVACGTAFDSVSQVRGAQSISSSTAKTDPAQGHRFSFAGCFTGLPGLDAVFADGG